MSPEPSRKLFEQKQDDYYLTCVDKLRIKSAALLFITAAISLAIILGLTYLILNLKINVEKIVTRNAKPSRDDN